MSDYKKRLLELAESLRQNFHDVGCSGVLRCDCDFFSTNKTVDELVMLINKLEEVYERPTNEPK
jgi:hypothetical protein